jgi:hypothetical protein
MPEPQRQPTPELIFETLNAYQRTAALKSAIELDVFTIIGEGATTASAIASRCGAAERGIRILCDYLVVVGLLAKNDGAYSLTPDSATFLDRRSPKCVASAMGFMLLPEMVKPFDNLSAAVRHGGTVSSPEGIVKPEDPVWVEFARSMAPLQSMPAEALARYLRGMQEEKGKVLDIAAGHGLFGIAVARHNPVAQIYSVDWESVLAVAKENARAAGVEDRFHPLPGSAMEIDLGTGYDLILLVNFLQILDPIRIHTLLPRLHAALAPGGRVVTLGFIPDENRVTPPPIAGFAIIMLATTPGGDAYTFSDCDSMFRAAGFSSSELQQVPGTPNRIIISRK